MGETNMQAVADEYKQNYMQVSSHVKTIESINLDRDYNIIYRPEDYEEYTDTISSAQGMLNTFTGVTWSQLKSMPNTIAGQAPLMNNSFDTALQYINLLVAQCNDPTSLSFLCTTLDTMQIAFASQLDLIDQLKTNLTNCHADFEDIADALQKIVDMAVADAASDEAQVEKLTQSVEKMKETIDAYAESLAANCGGFSTAGICLVVINLLVNKDKHKKLIRCLNGALGSIFVATGVGIILDSVAIAEQSKLIEQALNDIDDLELDIAQLQLIADDFKRYASDTENMQPCLQQMYNVWNAFYEDLAAISDGIKKIQDCEDDTEQFSAEFWQGIYEEMETLKADYATFVSNVALFDVSGVSGYQVELEIGMSSEETAAAIAAAQPIDLIRYLTA